MTDPLPTPSKRILIRPWYRIVCPDPRRRQRVEAAADEDEDEEAGPPAKRQRTIKDMWGGKVPGGAVVGLRAWGEGCRTHVCSVQRGGGCCMGCCMGCLAAARLAQHPALW